MKNENNERTGKRRIKILRGDERHRESERPRTRRRENKEGSGQSMIVLLFLPG
jgi:hypothetical protein